MVNARNKLAGPPLSKPFPIWTYSAVPIVPPIPARKMEELVSNWSIGRRGPVIVYHPPISWMCRGLSLRCVWSPGCWPERMDTDSIGLSWL